MKKIDPTYVLMIHIFSDDYINFLFFLLNPGKIDILYQRIFQMFFLPISIVECVNHSHSFLPAINPYQYKQSFYKGVI